MKFLTEKFVFNIPSRRGYVNITSKVEDLVRLSGVKEGLVLCNAMHITASVYINDDESGLLEDYEEWLEKLAPHEPINNYRHNRTGEDKRFHKVILTHKGRNLSDKIIPQIENIISDLFVSILSVRERRMLSEILAITFDGL